MFRRKIEAVINQYFAGEKAKILVIDGARQVGKSYIVRKLGKEHFKNYVEINLKDDYEGNGDFSKEKTSTTESFYLHLSSLYGDKLGSKDDTLIFLDEIQVYPHLLTMLKALKRDDRFTYIVSGSLLGVTLKHAFIPMGSIDEVRMYPLDFEEFCSASHVGQEVIDYLRDCYKELKPVEEGVHETMLRRFKEYLLCGGLPDAVKEFVINRNIMAMRKVHELTQRYYEDDCAQYDNEHALKIARIYSLLPSYMENKVKRIVANKIAQREKDTFATYQDEFDYLISSGLVLPTKAVSDPRFPLLESSSKNLLKLYYNDVGLLTNILYKNNIDVVLGADKGVNLGSVYETVAAMELSAHSHDLFYFDSKKTGEVDFLINDYDASSVLPIEIKSGDDQYNFRALPKLVDPEGRYSLKKGYVLGNKNIVKEEGNIITLPIYMIMFI